MATLRVQLTPAARLSLETTPRTYVTARFEMDGHPPRDVGVRLKGRYGSFRSLDQKPALKVKFNHAEGTPFLGLKKIALNNLAQDPSGVAEWAAYSLFRAVGVPAPRVGYAVLSIDGETKGIYAVVESMDDVALDRWFPSTAHLYEGAYGQDLFPQIIADYEIDEGADDRTDLATVVAAIEMNEPAMVYEATAALVRWPEVVAAMATEIFIGHWDGYAPTRNNYFLHFDDQGRLSLLPWGTDQTFRDVLALHVGDGRLFEVCLAHPECRALYDATLLAVADAVDETGLQAQLEQRRTLLSPLVELDRFGVGNAEALGDEIERTRAFLTERQADVRARSQCLSGADRDADDDGHDCSVDCDDDDPDTYPGAEEICGDQVDQDCSGWPDDGPECPDCETVERGIHRYLVCTTPRTWAAARDHCASQGSAVAVFEHPAEATWVSRQAFDRRRQRYWIGLTDADREGTFTWIDGQALAASYWAEDQPNDNDDADCVVTDPDWYGRWNDQPCGRQYAVICEAPCAAEDVDGDGYSVCGGDCGEGDPTVGPGRDELCGNAVDEDCDGEVDDVDVCPRCTPVQRGAHAYALCAGERTWADARQECRQMGYDLVVLQSAGEADWLVERALYLEIWGFWIGLTDSATEGRFRWVDGQPVDYAPWGEGEPNDAGGEDCAHVFPDGWNDLPCDAAIPFACEAACAGLDADGDGLDDCGADCDDGDPEIGVECPE